MLNTNPKRFYVENVRSFFNVSTPIARTLCNMAVRDGYFNKKVGLECPNDDRMIKSFNTDETIEGHFVCTVCELEGREHFEFDASELKRIEFYELK